MKSLTASLVFMGLLLPVVGQDKAYLSKWDVGIPGPISDGTPSDPLPEPKPIKFVVKSSRTSRMDVTEAPVIPGLPPVTGKINVTVQSVEEPVLPDPAAPLPALPPDDPAVIVRMAELAEKHRGTRLVFLSATVLDHNRTLLRIYPDGKHGGAVTAWSNLDFNHFSGFSIFRVKDGVDGGIHDYLVVMGISDEDTGRLSELSLRGILKYEAPRIPALPDPGKGGPCFTVVEGEAGSSAMDTLEQLHDLYRTEGGRMEAAHHAREKKLAERKAHLLANPPKPADVTIRVWRRNRAGNPQEVSR